MFRTMSAADPPTSEFAEVDPPEQLVPLSHLQLDLPAPSEGWNTYLNSRSIPVAEDDLGRAAVARSVARMLLTERREAEAQQARKRQEVERLAVEADQLRRAQIWRGVAADRIPDGLAPAAAMLAATYDARPRRTSVLQEALAGESLTFHSFGTVPDEE